MYSEKGQTLLEMVVVIAVALLVVSALTFATIASLRNSQFAKNQAQATKLAQEGVEKVRSIRDRDGSVIFEYASGGNNPKTEKFSNLWALNMSNDYCGKHACYFKLAQDLSTKMDVLTNEGVDDDVIDNIRATNLDYETINNFKRQVQISDFSIPKQEKTVTVVVTWTDFAGSHESRITTILRRLQ